MDLYNLTAITLCVILGEIANLMSIDAQRLQDLTPYLHAVWYSFFQIAVALYFLYEQVKQY